MLNFELDQDSQRILAGFQELRREKFAPRALEYDRQAAFPVEILVWEK